MRALIVNKPTPKKNNYSSSNLIFYLLLNCMAYNHLRNKSKIYRRRDTQPEDFLWVKEKRKDARCERVNPNRKYSKDENQTYQEYLCHTCHTKIPLGKMFIHNEQWHGPQDNR